MNATTHPSPPSGLTPKHLHHKAYLEGPASIPELPNLRASPINYDRSKGYGHKARSR